MNAADKAFRRIGRLPVAGDGGLQITTDGSPETLPMIFT